MSLSDSSPINRYRRAKFWDYEKGASLFITISTDPKLPCFGRIVDGKMILSALGLVVADAIASITNLNPGIKVYGRVVMPDHVHMNVSIAPGLAEPLKVLGKAISRFKNYTIKQSKILAEHSSAISTAFGAAPSAYGESGDGRAAPSAYGESGDGRAAPSAYGESGDGRAAPSAYGESGDGRAAPSAYGESGDGRAALGLKWQQGYHDRLCLSRDFIDSAERYIAYNPMKWQLMYATPGALAIHEPLDSQRLDPAEYWKGVGNIALLSPEEKLVSLRISRRLSTAQVAAAVARISKAVDLGYVILSGFVSTGEKAVRDILCARKDARFIRILPSCIPNRRYKPESRYIDAFQENRYLEIARGNDEVNFDRAACLDYNAEIIEIAKAGEGMALYFKPEGLVRL